MYDVCIVGAGIIGCAIARELSRFELSILVLEKGNDVSLAATKANSGILHGGYNATPGTLKAHFANAGNKLYDQWNRDLHFGIHRCGSMVLAFNEEEKKKLLPLQQSGIQNAVEGLRILERMEILERERMINPDVIAALHCPQAAVVSPYEVALALAENACSNEVDFRFLSSVKKLNRIRVATANGAANGTVGSAAASANPFDTWSIETESDSYQSKVLINAAGVHSDFIAKLSGLDQYSTVPKRGNYYVFRRDYQAVKSILFQTPTQKGKGVLVCPTYHGNIMIGPNSELVDDKQNTECSEDGLQFIVEQAKMTIPSLDMKMALRSYAGIRASLQNSQDFVIDDSLQTCIHLLGIDSPGLTAAPCIAHYVVKKLASLLSLEMKDNFHATRKAYIPCQREVPFLPINEVLKFAKLEKGDPKRMVCQCEQVREATIHKALTRYPQPISIDGIKRRTRASMGFCQGKICRPRLRTLLAEHIGTEEGSVEDR